MGPDFAILSHAKNLSKNWAKSQWVESIRLTAAGHHYRWVNSL